MPANGSSITVSQTNYANGTDIIIGGGGGGGGSVEMQNVGTGQFLVQNPGINALFNIKSIKAKPGSPISVETPPGSPNEIHIGMGSLNPLSFGRGIQNQNNDDTVSTQNQYNPTLTGQYISTRRNTVTHHGHVDPGNTPLTVAKTRRVWAGDEAGSPNWHGVVRFRGSERIKVVYVGIDDGLPTYEIRWLPY